MIIHTRKPEMKVNKYLNSQKKFGEWRKGGLEHLAEALKDPSYVYELIIALLFLLYVSKEETDQIIWMILIKLAKKGIEKLRAVGIKSWLMQGLKLRLKLCEARNLQFYIWDITKSYV